MKSSSILSVIALLQSGLALPSLGSDATALNAEPVTGLRLLKDGVEIVSGSEMYV